MIKASPPIDFMRILASARRWRLGLASAKTGCLALVGLLGLGALVTSATDRYVSLSGTNDVVHGYTNWVGAATNIQDAISACVSGDVVWVTNGFVCDSGGVTNWPSGTILTNRIAITNAITVRSVNNDAANTMIVGAWNPGTTNGPAAVRCVYMTNNSALIGFTLTNGATLTTNESAGSDLSGGGVLCQSSATISNCIIAGNAASMYGGGSYNGIWYNCTIVGNMVLEVYARGGGGYGGTMYNCKLINNLARQVGGTSTGGGGGGAFSSILYNCLVIGNAAAFGGGVHYSTMYNCTIVGNMVGTAGTGYGGGIYGITGTLYGETYNCIIYSNRASSGPNYYNHTSNKFHNCCTEPASDGWAVGNITNNPVFIDLGIGYGLTQIAGDYHLRNNSPCLNAGTNGTWTTNALDLDGRTRIRYGTVDMGAYEKIYEGTIFRIP